MVGIRLPTATLTGVTQERTALPSRCTVHAPHSATPQPYLVPVRPTCSRIAHSSGVPGSTLTSLVLPLIVKRAMPLPSPDRSAENIRHHAREGKSYRWQATWPLPSRGCSVGSTSEQIGIADGQRGWKRHPDGRLRALGTSPAMARSRGGSSGWGGSAAAKRALGDGGVRRGHHPPLAAAPTDLPRAIPAMRGAIGAPPAR